MSYIMRLWARLLHQHLWSATWVQTSTTHIDGIGAMERRQLFRRCLLCHKTEEV